MIKTITTVFVVLALAAVSPAQLTYDAIRIAVAPGVVCPTAWTEQTTVVVSEEEYHINVPAVLGGRSFLVPENLVDALWPNAASKAAAIVQGILEFTAETSSQKRFCALLP